MGQLQPTAANALLQQACDRALAYLSVLDSRTVREVAGAGALRETLDIPLPAQPTDPSTALDDVVRAVEPGLVNTSSGRFFGWVVGGTLPVAIAADWLTSTWDQNAAIYATSPAAAMVEEVAARWLLDLLGLPATASVGFVTGSQMAHVTAFMAARHRLLASRGWDAERRGLAGAPAIRVLAGEHRHETVDRAARLVGIGTAAIETVDCDSGGRIDVGALEVALRRDPGAPTIVCLQAGELNTGAIDPFQVACDAAHDVGAWVHVDGAFGLWAGASPRRRGAVAGVERADSWSTDGHKWLNVPYDSGYAIVADAEAHRGAFRMSGSYFDHAADARDPLDWNPEWSRRARGFPTYAALRTLGREGVAEIVDGCCDRAERLVEGIGALAGAAVVARPVVNQGLVRFLDPAGDDDARTDEVIARVVEGGEAWFGGVTWHGQRCMRISVTNWRTTDADVDRAVRAVHAALGA